MILVDEMKRRYEGIQARIARSAEISGRHLDEITMIAVSKFVPTERIQLTYELGIRDFGESRLQEALPKIDCLPDDIHWHFIGSAQTNKLKKICANFQTLHSLENERQLSVIADIVEPMNCFVEVNIANEDKKSGISLENLDNFVKHVLESKQVNFLGLMMIGPNLEDAESMRIYFRNLKQLNDKYGGRFLSMGMSSDFEVAIQEGATHVRIGTALFGQR